MKKKLLREESMIIECLKTYGPLRVQQLINYLSHKQQEVAIKIIKGLHKSRYIYISEDGYASLMPSQKINDEMVKAFWAFLKFSGSIREGHHYPSSYPSQIFFLKDNKQYEISVVKAGDEATVLFLKQKNSICENEDDKTKFIVVVDSEQSFEKCVSLINPQEIKIAYAIMDFSNGNIPNIEWKV